ncbi:GGDEF domain-containing protein [bacterium]|nr:GGDEF domain-containing protein [bacterium]
MIKWKRIISSIGSSPVIASFLTPVPYRAVLPFSAFVLVFAGWSELLLHHAWLSICWTLVLIIGITYWLMLNLQAGETNSFDQISLAQFYLALVNLAFSLVRGWHLLISFYLLMMVLVVMSFPRRTIQLISIQFGLIIFYQAQFLHSPLSTISPDKNVVVAFAFSFGAVILSYLKIAAAPPVFSSYRDSKDLAPVSLNDVRDMDTENHGPLLYDNEDSLQAMAGERIDRVQQILDMVHDIIGSFSTLYFELDRNQGTLSPTCWSVSDPDALKTDLAIRLGKGPIGWAAKNDSPNYWNRSLGGNEPEYYLNKVGVESMLIVPVLEGHQVAGCIVLDSRKINAFDTRDEKIVTVFARQLALMYEVQDQAHSISEKAELFKSLQQGGNRLLKTLKLDELLTEILNQMRAIVTFPHDLIVLFDPKTERLELVEVSESGLEKSKGTTFDLLEGLAGYILQHHNEAVFFSEAKKMLADRPLLGYGEPEFEAQSLLFLPLKSSNRVLGLVILWSDSEQSLTISNEVLSILANQYCLALINAQMYHALERLAVTDGLTQLINHRHFQEMLGNEFKRLEREPHPLSLILLDIDHFKKFNDTYGHPIGDQVLKRVAKILKDSCRDIDTVARYGGEEFAVILINTELDGSIQMAERIRQTVAQDTLTIEALELQVTVSLGVATFPDNCSDKQQLIDLADQALYKAKETGRNRVVHCNQV